MALKSNGVTQVPDGLGPPGKVLRVNSAGTAGEWGDPVISTKSDVEGLGIDVPATNLTGTIPAARLSTATTQAESDDSTKIATTAYVVDKITTLIGGAPSTLNDLNELAAAINDDANYNSTLTTALATKLPLAGGTMTGDLIFGDDDKVTFGAGSGTASGVTSNLDIYHDGSDSYIVENTQGGKIIVASDNIQIGDAYDDYFITAGYGGVALYSNAFPVFDVASNGINIYGRIYVTGTVDGRDVATDGTKLDGIEAGATADQTTITVSTAGSNVYKFTGDGFPVESGDNPNMYFDRGQTYVINNSQHASHPLDIRLSDGGAAYTSGVSGASGAKVTFTVPMDAPDKLVYQCTSHSAMVGNIYITGKGINGYAVEVVSSLPSSPDSNTIYFVTG